MNYIFLIKVCNEINVFFISIFSLMSNSLTINSGGPSPATRRAESRARSVQRRLNIAPLAMNFDENSNSPEKTMMSPEELSFYTGNSPQGSPRCSISPCMDIGMLSPGFRETETIDEYNSRDSGYGASQTQSQKKKNRKLFDFVQPSGIPPRRIDSMSPPKTQATMLKTNATSCFRSFNSLSSDSMESMDDECMDLLDMDDMDDNARLPTSFNNIISGSIKTTNETRVPLLRRCLSLTDSNAHRARNNIRESHTPDVLKSISENASPFQPKVTDSGSKACKRYKASSSDENKENAIEITPPARPVLRKSISMNDAIIMNALARCKYLT